ncbi:hypothetical protein D3C80_1485110 [compost metagenome]
MIAASREALSMLPGVASPNGSLQTLPWYLKYTRSESPRISTPSAITPPTETNQARRRACVAGVYTLPSLQIFPFHPSFGGLHFGLHRLMIGARISSPVIDFPEMPMTPFGATNSAV